MQFSRSEDVSSRVAFSSLKAGTWFRVTVNGQIHLGVKLDGKQSFDLTAKRLYTTPPDAMAVYDWQVTPIDGVTKWWDKA